MATRGDPEGSDPVPCALCNTSASRRPIQMNSVFDDLGNHAPPGRTACGTTSCARPTVSRYARGHTGGQC